MASLSRFFYLLIICLIGFAALIYQLYGIRVLFMFFVNNSQAAAIAISSFLAGLACSSVYFPHLKVSSTQPLRLLWGMMLATAIYGYAFLVNYPLIPLALDSIHQWVQVEWQEKLLKYSLMWLYLFIPAFFIGGCFPLVNGLYLRSLEKASHETGTVYFWDTFGGIIGALVAGFILIPLLGVRATVVVAICSNVFIAILLSHTRVMAVVLAVVLVCVVAIEKERYAEHSFLQYASEKALSAADLTAMDMRFGEILFQRESPYGRITVGERTNEQGELARTLFINYRGMCSTALVSEKELGSLIMPLLPAESEVVNIGLGCGFTAANLAFDVRTRLLDIVEINPIIPYAARFFAKDNHNVLDAGNIRVTIQDGAEWLRNDTRKLDAIVVDVEEVETIYSSPLFTQEYFQIIRDHLKEGGVFALWSFQVNPEFSRILQNTLEAVFPYVVVRHYDEEAAVNYYASMRPIEIPQKESRFYSEVAKMPSHTINTIDNNMLEKHYNRNDIFALPVNYQEKFFYQDE